MAQDNERRAGQLNTGGGGRMEQGVHHIKAGSDRNGAGTANKGSVLALDAVASNGVITTFYLHVDSTGDLKISSVFPSDTNAGIVVGVQT